MIQVPSIISSSMHAGNTGVLTTEQTDAILNQSSSSIVRMLCLVESQAMHAFTLQSAEQLQCLSAVGVPLCKASGHTPFQGVSKHHPTPNGLCYNQGESGQRCISGPSAVLR